MLSVVVVGRSIGNGLEEIILWRNNDWERCHLLEMGDMTHRHWERGGEGGRKRETTWEIFVTNWYIFKKLNE